MAWVNPSTWVAGQQVTKGQFNDWNNSMAAVGDHSAWSTWAPVLKTLGALTSGFDNDFGGGAVSGAKARLGDVGVCAFNLNWGSTGSAGWPASGLASQRLTLPWAAAGLNMPCGWATLYIADADNTYMMAPYIATSTCAEFYLTFSNSSKGKSVWSGLGTTYCPELHTAYAGSRAVGVLVYRIA